MSGFREVRFDPNYLDEFASFPEGPEDERFERIREAVDSLPAPLREVIELHCWEQVRPSEAARRVGLTRGGEHHRRSRAIKALREALNDL